MQETRGEYGMGPGGACICTKCSYREPHQRGVPCSNKRCPRCGSPLMRDEATV